MGASDVAAAPPSGFAATREALRSLACYVISPKRKALTGRISLQPTGTGFGTPPFDDGTRIAVDGDRLRVEPVADAPITTLRHGAELVGVELRADPGVGHDLPPFAPDDELTVDGAASRWLGAWYELGDGVLRRLGGQLVDATVDEPQLWPEHFDLAVVVTVGDRTVNVGFSPGDATVAEPYVYVGPHDRTGLDGEYWNAPFGAVRTHSQLRAARDQADAAIEFITEGMRLVNAGPRNSH